MSANQKRLLFCVWNNQTDQVVAIDEDADKCAELMDISRQTFYKMLIKPCKKWHIERVQNNAETSDYR